MKRIVVGAVLSVVALAAAAQATTTTLAFTTVDAVKMSYNQIYVTGVQDGATTASTVNVYCSGTSCPEQLLGCEKLALVAMTKPGQYVFEIEKVPGSYIDRCTLRRVAP